MAPKRPEDGKKGVAQVVKAPKKVIRKDGYFAQNVPDLKAELKRRGAKFTSKANKAELVKLLDELDANGQTEDGSAEPAEPEAAGTKKKGTATKKPTTTKKPTATKAPPAAGPQEGVDYIEGNGPVKAPKKVGAKKPVPKAGFRTGSGKAKSPSPDPEDDPLGKTKGGRVVKATVAEKSRVAKYRAALVKIMGKIRNDQGGIEEVRAGVFKGAYNDLVRALDALDAIQQAETAEEPAKGDEADVPEPFEEDEEEEEDEGPDSPEKKDGEDGDYQEGGDDE